MSDADDIKRKLLPNIGQVRPDAQDEQDAVSFIQQDKRAQLIREGAEAALNQMAAQVEHFKFIVNLKDDILQLQVVGAATAAAAICTQLVDGVIVKFTQLFAALAKKVDTLEKKVTEDAEKVTALTAQLQEAIAVLQRAIEEEKRDQKDEVRVSGQVGEGQESQQAQPQ